MKHPVHSSLVVLLLFGFLSASNCLQSLYSEARNVRTLEGHDQAVPLYQEILKRNPTDVTVATRIAADKQSATRHDAFGQGSLDDKLRCIEVLKSSNYNCNNIADLVFANNPTLNQRAKQSSAPLVLQPLRAGVPAPPLPTCALGTCVQLFLLAVCLPFQHCVDVLGQDFCELLQTLGLAFVDDDLLIPYVHVFPVKVGKDTIYLATDLHPNVLSRTSIGDDGAVMYIGPDSLALIDHWSCLQHVKETDSILDIGCGSGIQALSLVVRSSGNPKVTCVDINERALRFTKLNFEWNNFDAPTLILGNINTATGKHFGSTTPKSWKELLGNSTTTYIVSNPPFLPVPVHDDTISSRYGLFSSGGASGEEFFQSLVGLSSLLLDRTDPSATLAVVSEFMNPSSNFGLKLSSWWSSADPARALLFTNEVAIDGNLYAQRRADSPKEASEWEDHLQREGIESVSPGLLFLKLNLSPKEMIQNESPDSHSVDLSQHLVPKTPEGSLWTPTNIDARDFTRHNIQDFELF